MRPASSLGIFSYISRVRREWEAEGNPRHLGLNLILVQCSYVRSISLLAQSLYTSMKQERIPVQIIDLPVADNQKALASTKKM